MATQGTSSSGSSPKNEKESVSMYMYDLYVAEFDNGDKMTGSISQVYAAQEVNGCAVTLHPYIEVRKAPAPIA